MYILQRHLYVCANDHNYAMHALRVVFRAKHSASGAGTNIVELHASCPAPNPRTICVSVSVKKRKKKREKGW